MPGPGMELIGEEEKQELLEVIESGYLFRYGSEDNPKFKAKVYSLENQFAKLSGVKYAVAVNSGTTALLVALGGLGIGPGDEVIVPGYTFVAGISSTIYARAIPILAEIDGSFNLDPDDVEKKITPRTKAIMAVHMLGNPARLDELKRIAERYNLILIEDAAQACGASYKGKPIGSIGNAGCFSFNIFKTITAGDGGMVITDNEGLYKRFFAFHDQGHSPMRKGVEIGKRPFLGLDFRMTELTAAVILAQLRKLEKIITTLRENKKRFKDGIANMKGVKFRDITDPNGECATVLTIILPSKEIAEKIARELGTKVVQESGWHVYSNMEQVLRKQTLTEERCPFSCPYYKGQEPDYHKGMLPNTDDLLSRSINIGIGVSDPGLGTAFGITITDGVTDIDERIGQFRSVAQKYLQIG